MPSVAVAILEDIAKALRVSGLFKDVRLGQGSSATVVPRAHLAYDGHDVFLSDDGPGSLWVRLRARVTVHTRSGDQDDGSRRAVDLCAAAAGTLLQDPHRQQRCRDLPIGLATEIGRTELTPGIRRPEVEAVFDVRCHFETEEL